MFTPRRSAALVTVTLLACAILHAQTTANPPPSGAAPAGETLSELLQAVAGYVVEYERSVGAVVSEEDYTQVSFAFGTT